MTGSRIPGVLSLWLNDEAGIVESRKSHFPSDCSELPKEHVILSQSNPNLLNINSIDPNFSPIIGCSRRSFHTIPMVAQDSYKRIQGPGNG